MFLVVRPYFCIMHFVWQSEFPVSAAALFAFHERPDAFAILQPPWQTTRILQPPRSLEVGTRVILETKLGPIWKRIVAEHVAYEPGVMFADRMIEGPFAAWLHRHEVTSLGPDRSRLTDDITYALPFGVLGRLFGGGFAASELRRLFAFRHEATLRAVTS